MVSTIKRTKLLRVYLDWDNVNPENQGTIICKATTEGDAYLIASLLNKNAMANDIEKWYKTCK